MMLHTHVWSAVTSRGPPPAPSPDPPEGSETSREESGGPACCFFSRRAPLPLPRHAGHAHLPPGEALLPRAHQAVQPAAASARRRAAAHEALRAGRGSPAGRRSSAQVPPRGPAGGPADPLHPLRHLPGRQPRGAPHPGHPAGADRRRPAGRGDGDQRAAAARGALQARLRARGLGGGLRVRSRDPAQRHGPGGAPEPAARGGGGPAGGAAGRLRVLQPPVEQLRALRHRLPLRGRAEPADRPVLRVAEVAHPGPAQRGAGGAAGPRGRGVSGRVRRHRAARPARALHAVDGQLGARPRRHLGRRPADEFSV